MVLWLNSVKRLNMHKFCVEEGLSKVLSKVYKKDRRIYEQLMSKIDEIVNCSDLDHYKNLRAPLQAYKRVHIGVFVLLFRLEDDTIIFSRLEHHDTAYFCDR